MIDIPVEAIVRAASRPDVLEAMRRFYTELDAAIASQPATCWNRSLCCRFGQYGHRLFVTTLEAAYYLASWQERDGQENGEREVASPFAVLTVTDARQVTEAPRVTKAGRATEAGELIDGRIGGSADGGERLTVPEVLGETCPHAFGGLCHVRAFRPMGCRIFFCDPAAQHWQGPMTETQLARLRRMHEELRVDYVYADWLDILRALRAARLAALAPA